MSIASEIQALQQDKSDIATAISNKGVTVPSGSGFDSFASLISSFPNLYYTKISLTENTNSISFQTNFEPKFIFFSCQYPWNSIKNYLDDVSGKEVRQIYYYYYCKENYLYNDYSNSIYLPLAFQKSNDGIYNPTTVSHHTIQSENIFTTTISRNDTSVAAWRFAGSINVPINYNIIVLG